jgi:hypothetical protein
VSGGVGYSGLGAASAEPASHENREPAGDGGVARPSKSRKRRQVELTGTAEQLRPVVLSLRERGYTYKLEILGPAELRMSWEELDEWV